MNIVVYDMEIRNLVDPDNGIKWDEYEKMGWSVGTSFSYKTGDYDVYFFEDRQRLFDTLLQADLIAGFNILGFDNPLLEAFGLPKDSITDRCYDILRESRLSMGWRPGDRFPKSMTLNHHLEAMFNMQKTEDSAGAPMLWQKEELGRLVSYNIADVRRERMVLSWIMKNGTVKTRAHGEHKILNDPMAAARGIWQIPPTFNP